MVPDLRFCMFPDRAETYRFSANQIGLLAHVMFPHEGAQLSGGFGAMFPYVSACFRANQKMFHFPYRDGNRLGGKYLRAGITGG
jgi:hypothetical protein